jgi:putative methionine-R-sulfoxide reductase with GAF domain
MRRRRCELVCYTAPMNAEGRKFLSELVRIVRAKQDRVASLEEMAGRIRGHRDYRWVGLYDIDHKEGIVRNIAWKGPRAPEYPTFPIGKGLTGAAIAERRIRQCW